MFPNKDAPEYLQALRDKITLRKEDGSYELVTMYALPGTWNVNAENPIIGDEEAYQVQEDMMSKC